MKKFFFISFSLIFFSVQAQDSKILGKVVDEFGLPLETVTVIVEGTTKGVVTDQNVFLPLMECLLNILRKILQVD